MSNAAMIFPLSPRELRDAEITVNDTDASAGTATKEAPDAAAGEHVA